MQGYRFPTLGQIPPVVKNIIIINVLFFLGSTLTNYNKSVELFGMFYFSSDFFRPHQLVTHLFMHGDLSHLFFNMFALFMFGRTLETVWNSKRFLTYYMITGLGAAIIHLLVTYLRIQYVSANLPQEAIDEVYANGAQIFAHNQNYLNSAMASLNALLSVPTVGASGAVFGVLLAFGMLFPNTELVLLFPPIPIKAKWFVLGYGVLELALGVVNRTGDNVAHFAHLGGMIFGFILIKYWHNKHRY